MKRLTKTQRRVLVAIKKLIEENKGSPTYVELAKDLNWASPNSAKEHVNRLETLGYLTVVRGISRGIRIN